MAKQRPAQQTRGAQNVVYLAVETAAFMRAIGNTATRISTLLRDGGHISFDGNILYQDDTILEIYEWHTFATIFGAQYPTHKTRTVKETAAIYECLKTLLIYDLLIAVKIDTKGLLVTSSLSSHIIEHKHR